MTLVEVTVALVIAALLFAALAAATLGSIKGSFSARGNQTAADFANARIEQLRQVDWAALAHNADEGTAYCALDGVSCSGTPTFEGRTLVVADGGYVSATPAATTFDSREYRAATYVTASSPGSGALRDISVIVEWEDHGVTNTKRADTRISESTRGLALPNFVLTPLGDSTETVNAGAAAEWGFEVTNNGAPDSFNVAVTGVPTVPSLYLDDGDGTLNLSPPSGPGDPAVDPPLTDTTSDAVVDSGKLDPLDSAVVWLKYAVPEGTGDGTTNVTVTVTSAAQPNEVTSERELALYLTVVSGAVTPSPTPTPFQSSPSSPVICADPNPAPTPTTPSGFTQHQWTLHNSGSVSWPTLPLPETGEIPGTAALRPMLLDSLAPAIPAGRELPPYATDLETIHPTRGRIVQAGGGFEASGAAQVADFRSAVAGKTYTGSIVMRTYVQRVPGGSASAVSLTARLYQYRSSGNKTDELLSPVTVTVSPWSCAGWQQVSFAFTITGTLTLTNNYVLSARIWNPGSEAVVLAYDHADYPSTLTVVQQ